MLTDKELAALPDAVRVEYEDAYSSAGGTRLSTRRALSESDCDAFARAVLRAMSEGFRRVRVYSEQGFVPGAYKWRCDIQFIEAVRPVGGEWAAGTGWGGAQRSNGRGELLVMQWRDKLAA